MSYSLKLNVSFPTDFNYKDRERNGEAPTVIYWYDTKVVWTFYCKVNAHQTLYSLWSTFIVNKWPDDLMENNLAFCDQVFILSLLQVRHMLNMG